MSVPIFLRLLGVLAILSFMAAILFPFFARGRECARCIGCISNSKQMGLGLIQYAQDNDSMLPNIYVNAASNTWRALIYPYIKSRGVFQCPNRHKDDPEENPIGQDGFAQSYAANYSGNDGRTQPDQGRGALAGPGSKPIALTDVPAPKNLIVLVEAAYNPLPQFNIDDARNFSPASRRLWAGHSGQGNYVFLDGHAKALRPQETDLETNGDGIKNLWYRDESQPLSANGVAVLQDAQQRFAP